MKFIPEQIAIAPRSIAAQQLLADLGITDWIHDLVTAQHVGTDDANTARLSFNHDWLNDGHGLELELIEYGGGANWLSQVPKPAVSHLGMHCTDTELLDWKRFFRSRSITIAQEVVTTDHTNPFLVERGRKYHYCVFSTRELLGFDLKFIVRLEG